MTGMRTLRLRGQEKKKLIKYDLSVVNYDNLKSLEHCLKYHKVDYWIYNGDLYTRDEKFSKALRHWLGYE